MRLFRIGKPARYREVQQLHQPRDRQWAGRFQQELLALMGQQAAHLTYTRRLVAR